MAKDKKKGNNSKRYLAGYIDLGLLGKREVFIFKNEKREKESQPAFRLVIKENGSWKEVGALWLREVSEKKQKDEAEEFVKG